MAQITCVIRRADAVIKLTRFTSLDGRRLRQPIVTLFDNQFRTIRLYVTSFALNKRLFISHTQHFDFNLNWLKAGDYVTSGRMKGEGLEWNTHFMHAGVANG